MPLSIQKLADVTRTVPIVFDSDDGRVELNITYRLSAMNYHLSDWVKEHGDDRNSTMGWLERVLVAWDIVDDGQPVPVTAEAMERYALSTPLLTLLMRAVFADSDADNLKKSYASVSLELDRSRPGTRS